MSKHNTKSIPILVDDSLNKAMSIKYAIFSLFGFAGIYTRIPAISEVSGNTVALITAVVVFLSAGVAAIAAWRCERGVKWRKLEIYSAEVFVPFAAMYAIALLWLSLVVGDDQRIGTTVLSMALLIMPIWRIRYLIRRGRAG